jgi:hypothetical protein
MTDENPITTWLIELRGCRTNLDDWHRVFRDRTVASVELSAGRDGEPAYFVHSRRFDGVPDTEAHGVATKLIAQMNGAAALCGGQSAQMVRLWYVRSPEKPQPMKEVSVSVESSFEFSATIGPPPEVGRSVTRAERQALRALETAGHSDHVAAALEHFGRLAKWDDLWVTYEIIERLWERTPPNIRGQPGNKPRAILMSRAWVSEDELHRFAESCNYHRHGEKKPPTPEQSANTDEAQRILGRILKKWLEEIL